MKKINRFAKELFAKAIKGVVKVNVNSTCVFFIHQAKVPECAKKLCRF